MRILLLGKTGLLGSEFAKSPEFKDSIMDFPRFDLSLVESIDRHLEEAAPQLIINCAAMSNVDECEKSPQLAQLINMTAVGKIGKFCERKSIPLIHFSTDYVFGSMENRPHIETDPILSLWGKSNYYGASKACGEDIIPEGCNALILRVSTLYGMGRRCHIHWLLDALKGKSIPKIAVDMLGTPSYTKDLVTMTKELMDASAPYGVYNFVPHGHCSRVEFAERFFSMLDWKGPYPYQKSTIKELNLLAPRPGNPLLSNAKLVSTGIHIPTWEESLEEFISNELVPGVILAA